MGQVVQNGKEKKTKSHIQQHTYTHISYRYLAAAASGCLLLLANIRDKYVYIHTNNIQQKETNETEEMEENIQVLNAL